MERRRISRGHDSSDGGVPTPGARRARVATASAALILAVGLSAYAFSRASGERGLVGLACVAGVLLVLVALLAAWDNGLTAGPALLLVAYVLAVADGGPSLDLTATLVAAALLGIVEFGSWSLELRDGAEERPLARLPSVFLLVGAGAAASTLVLAVGGVRTGAGLALWVVGAAAAIGLLVLIARPVTPSTGAAQQ